MKPPPHRDTYEPINPLAHTHQEEITQAKKDEEPLDVYEFIVVLICLPWLLLGFVWTSITYGFALGRNLFVGLTEQSWSKKPQNRDA